MEHQNKHFNSWNQLKQKVNSDNRFRSFKQRDIFYCNIGQNFVRPVIILRKFNQYMFFGIPLSSQIKEGPFYHEFTFIKKETPTTNIALLSQLKLFSSNRLLCKIGVINKNDFEVIKNKMKDLID